MRFARGIQVRMTHVNQMETNDTNTAFGGEKVSGIGRFDGRWVLDEATEHRVSVQHARRAYPI